ncbi:MAG: hypothetical protein MRY83_24570, partial [Flavobacteriales bacterium]|nr:hypothetical protein [Flavobacteriales bacterium]
MARKLPEGSYLLDKNVIVLRGDCKVELADIQAILKQKPNRKIASVLRFHLFMYNLGSNLKESKIKNWLTETVGEAPVILDSTLLDKSVRQISILLKNKGYFNNVVRDSVVVRPKKKKAVNHFIIYPGDPYKISQITISMKDNDLLPYLQKVDKSKNSKPLLRKGDLFDVDRMDSERSRISREMQNLGFYYFEKEHVSYQVDTSIGGRGVKVKQIIKNPTLDINDSIHILKHKKYKIDEILIRGNNQIPLESQYTDKLIPIGDYKFRPDLLYKNIFIKPEEYYNLEKTKLTYRRISDLKVFRRVEIGFDQSPQYPDSNLLSCYVTLTPMQKHSF